MAPIMMSIMDEFPPWAGACKNIDSKFMILWLDIRSER